MERVSRGHMPLGIIDNSVEQILRQAQMHRPRTAAARDAHGAREIIAQ